MLALACACVGTSGGGKLWFVIEADESFLCMGGMRRKEEDLLLLVPTRAYGLFDPTAEVEAEAVRELSVEPRGVSRAEAEPLAGGWSKDTLGLLLLPGLLRPEAALEVSACEDEPPP